MLLGPEAAQHILNEQDACLAPRARRGHTAQGIQDAAGYGLMHRGWADPAWANSSGTARQHSWTSLSGTCPNPINPQHAKQIVRDLRLSLESRIQQNAAGLSTPAGPPGVRLPSPCGPLRISRISVERCFLQFLPQTCRA